MSDSVSLYQDLSYIAQSPPIISVAGLLYERPLWSAGVHTIRRAQSLYIPSKSYRIGARFEALIAALIKADELFDIIHHGFRANAPANIPGEGDFYLRHLKTGRIYHVEVTVKFYFAAQNKGTLLSEWQGPNGKDTAAKKLKKLYEKQTRLYLPNTDSLVKDTLPKNAIKMVYWRGGFFPHIHDKNKCDTRYPACFSVNAIQGAHMRLSDAPPCAIADIIGHDAPAIILHRQEVLSRFVCTKGLNDRCIPFSEALDSVCHEVSADGYHRAIALMHMLPLERGGAQILLEAERFYVLPDHAGHAV